MASSSCKVNQEESIMRSSVKIPFSNGKSFNLQGPQSTYTFHKGLKVIQSCWVLMPVFEDTEFRVESITE